MRWLPNISSSAASSSDFSTSSSSSSSSSFNNHNLVNSRNNSIVTSLAFRVGSVGSSAAAAGGGGPKLTRQRKLRHLTDQDLAGTPTEHHDLVALPRSQSTSSTPCRISPSSTACPLSLSRLSPPPPGPVPVPLTTPVLHSVPVPLPLPPENPSSGDGELRFPSPKERGDVAADGVHSASPPAALSSFAIRCTRKNAEHVEGRSSCASQTESTGVGRNRDRFRVSVPIRSAPTSPFASPVLSPERIGAATTDLFNIYQKMAKANHVWSAPEMMKLDMSGLPPPAFLDISAFSSSNSPLHSPCRSPRQARSPSRSTSPINAKVGVENPHGRRESNATVEVHPLPLPPGAAMPSLSTPVKKALAKIECVPMKCHWQKGKLIGRGTFGSVYVATNRETGALCAMKEVEMFPDDPKSAESIKQLQQEIKVLSQLKHQNIVQYYGSEIVDDRFYIYLEYVHPGSINRYFREHCGAITESVVRSFSRHILSGLAYLHSTKTIHRDIKGANLLVDASGVVKLADFGMAKHLTGQAADLSLKGSPYWMAPELMQTAVMQKDTGSDLALAVDIWSLGCTIIEMFTGKPPWSEYEGAAAMFKVMKDTPTIPEALSHEGKDFLRCCFRRNPAERPTANALLEHRWLKNSQQLDATPSAHPINGTRNTDLLNSPRVSEARHDRSHIVPSSQSSKAKLISNSFLNYSFSPRLADDLIMKLPT